MRKQAAALVTPACSRKLLPPCQQPLPRTVHLGAAAAHRSSSLGFPASRGCSPADTDFSAAVLLLARAAASSGSPQTVCRAPDAAHLALALALAICYLDLETECRVRCKEMSIMAVNL
ncbi:hypothetical protein NDU88_006130 [Pleurodeles waltl]|uniref:Uncharacterized protein n=1 Tax=Pleurodeles waltl TaxID=8319 RepID=A0AAV7PHF4_PLEWA|nr:hypothetical protein NDU88_006130 [Pleurodeles waltl]